VNGCAKIDAAGNVTLNGVSPATSAMNAASRAAGESTGSSGATISCTASSTGSPRSLRNVTVLPVRTPVTAS
jgi:hypothetical protein